MQRKLIFVSLIIIFLLVDFAQLVFAQEEFLFGQGQFYTVIFRGNGEAIVYGKLVLNNPNEEPLTDFSFEIPKVSPTELVLYQMKFPLECVRYDYRLPGQPCVEWQEPDYYYYSHRQGKAEYQKIQYTKSGNLYRFSLPNPVEPHKSTAIIVGYAAKGYVKESFGLFKFNFETIKVDSRIEEIKVVVDVDTDLFLKGKKAEVNYGLPKDEIAFPQTISSRSLDSLVGTIGRYGPLVKEAKNLAPNESFIVKGEYAKSWFRLYLSSILIVIVILVLIFAGFYFLQRFFKKREKKSDKGETMTGQGETTAFLEKKKEDKKSNFFDFTNLWVSFFSVLLVFFFTYLLLPLFKEVKSYLCVGIEEEEMFIILIIPVFLLYFLVIFGPAIFLATKKGWKAFIYVLIYEFFWYLLLIILSVLFIHRVCLLG